MSDESNKQFEQAFKNWHPDKTGPYIKHIAEYFWEQSRAALVVELPNKITEENRLQNGHVLPEVASYDEAIDDCADAIRAAGITVKGEGDE